MKKGFLITFEGGEGCGKSTQIRLFSDYLRSKKVDFVLTKEPGETEIGEQLREILLNSKSDISPITELFLMTADRSNHVEKVLKPALESGKVVVSDRYYHSCYVYQGTAGNIPLDKIKKITEIAIDGVKPDLVILLDVSYDEGFGRKSRDEKLKNLDRFESKGRSYHEKVRQGYLDLAKEDKAFVVIDAADTVERVHQKIVDAFEKAYKKAEK